MKIIRTPGDLAATAPTPNPVDAPAASATMPRHSWKMLVVDDEPDMRTLTRMNLKGFCFAGRDLEIIDASSAAEARFSGRSSRCIVDW